MSAPDTVISLAGLFNRSTGNLLKTFEARARTEADHAAVETIRRRLLLLKNASGPEAPLTSAAPILVAYDKVIMSPDPEVRDKFILHVDIESERVSRGITATPDEVKIITELVAVIRRHYSAATPAVRAGAISELQAMLEYSLRYMILGA